MVQLSHLYMITGKKLVLTIQTFVGKVMSLLFNMLTRYRPNIIYEIELLVCKCLKKSPLAF